MATIRGTFESAQFAAQKEALNLDPKLFDELLFAITWVLGHKPDEFPLIPKTRLRRIRTANGVFGLPALVIYATVDDEDTCTLQVIEADLDPGDGAFTEADLDF